MLYITYTRDRSLRTNLLRIVPYQTGTFSTIYRYRYWFDNFENLFIKLFVKQNFFFVIGKIEIFK